MDGNKLCHCQVIVILVVCSQLGQWPPGAAVMSSMVSVAPVLWWFLTSVRPSVEGNPQRPGNELPLLRSGAEGVPNVQAAAEEKNQSFKETWCYQRRLLWQSCVEVVFFPFYNEMKWRKMGVLCFIFSTLPPTTIKCRIKDWFIYFVLIFENVLVEFSLSFSGLEFRRVWFFLMLCLLCVSAVWC